MKVEVDVLGSPSLIVRTVSVGVKQHLTLNSALSTLATGHCVYRPPLGPPDVLLIGFVLSCRNSLVVDAMILCAVWLVFPPSISNCVGDPSHHTKCFVALSQEYIGLSFEMTE